ncbi:protein kinase, putative [Bodo saltans]|uniref:Protein kinase, putative n=1 Tax=Bodo saltans TaxID=75058 RepID=A0A0S4INH2_BODSA|nr:protein kinase, putative [Bodo saltans]|eukprot:CUF66151.1 protein kinase, putative [Bodo saltans]
MDKYDLLQQIGDGTFGSVAKGVHKKTGQLVAVKRMKQKYYTWDECIKLPEVQVLRKLQAHPNVIKLREVVRENNELFFVFEFMDGDLLGVIRKCKQNMPPAQA